MERDYFCQAQYSLLLETILFSLYCIYVLFRIIKFLFHIPIPVSEYYY